MNKEIVIALRDLGIPANLLGYGYLKCAVQLCLDDESYLHSMVGRLYPAVAEQCGSTPKRVERAIRHAIETGWSLRSIDAARFRFGFSGGADRERPTNSELIATVAEELRLEQEAQG